MTAADKQKNIPLAMMEYWIIEAVFKACDTLKLGGLQEIALPTEFKEEKVSKGRRAKGPQSNYVARDIEATVTIEMRFSQIEDFLLNLFDNPRVPFVDVTEIKYSKTEEILNSRLKLVERMNIGAESLEDGANGQGDEEDAKLVEFPIPEPPVLVEIKLRALSWGKRKLPKKGDKGDE